MASYRTPLGKYAYYMKNNVETLHRRFKPLNRISFSHDEFLALFAPPEHWEILKTASEVAAINATGGYHGGVVRHHSVMGGSASIMFIVAASGAPLMPRNLVVLPQAPSALVERLSVWVNREIEVAMEFARVNALVNWLDANCATKDQMRFLWPPIVSLCMVQEYTTALGERLREFKTPSSLPSMPAEVKAACRSTSATVTTAMMLDETPAPFSAPVTVTLAASEHYEDEGALGRLRV
jgi:hypothetical protein